MASIIDDAYSEKKFKIYSMLQKYSYPARIATLYAITWFIDLLDTTILNVALPRIAVYFHTTATSAEWAIVGFLLAFTATIAISGWLGDRFGPKKIFLLGQIVYFVSSFACGLSWSLSALIFFRITQGLGGGLITPVGGAMLMRNAPKEKWAKYTARINMIALIAPALGPVFAGYVTSIFGWPWLFYLKLPVLFMCILLSFYWIREEKHETKKFDWPGFVLSFIFIITFLVALTEFADRQRKESVFLLFVSLLTFFGFLYWEKRAKFPLIPFSIFRHRLFTVGNIIQSAANLIFLGTFFIMAFYFQYGLEKSVIQTGWILSSVTPGMMLIQPVIGRYYNRFGPCPFVFIGLILLSLGMFSLCFLYLGISVYLLAFILFLIGIANALIQNSNVMAIFSDVNKAEMSIASSLYNLFKQISGAFGVALSTMILTVVLFLRHLPKVEKASSAQVLSSFKLTFGILGIIPLLALFVFFGFYRERG